MTIMVPLGNVSFTFHFMPGHQPLRATDVIGLLLIVVGLVAYRFLEDIMSFAQKRKKGGLAQEHFTKSLLSFEDDATAEVEV